MSENNNIIELLKNKKEKEIERLNEQITELKNELGLIENKILTDDVLEMRYDLFFQFNKKIKSFKSDEKRKEAKKTFNKDLEYFDNYFRIQRMDILKQKYFCFSDIYFQ
jgi:hypothetical protein